ncbi:hypothetical protein [Solimonas soli]|uniref:hypothetical protein n=1 Tax=Solimonas soli TaxID=413479 RepID=UPI0004B4DD24|nr:hypothetical protein [Solimonas soli]
MIKRCDGRESPADASFATRCAFVVATLSLAGAAYGQGPPKAAGDGLLGKALSAAQSAAPAAPDEDVETVVVRPDAFAESDRKLQKVSKGLPGADDAAAVKRDMVDNVKDYFARREDPNALDDDTKKTLLKSFEPANNNP